MCLLQSSSSSAARKTRATQQFSGAIHDAQTTAGMQSLLQGSKQEASVLILQFICTLKLTKTHQVHNDFSKLNPSKNRSLFGNSDTESWC
jgi:hypothetical protein